MSASPHIDWAWAGRGLELESGDLHVVVPFEGGLLAALIDGLGHGHEAAMAARAAEPILNEHAADAVADLFHACHGALRRTRGAAIGLASFVSDTSSISWGSIGNVDGILVRAGEQRAFAYIPQRGGVVGYQMPNARIDTVSVLPGDTLVLTTDGLTSGIADLVGPTRSADEIARAILARHARSNDDAHVVVVRYNGPRA